MKCECCQEELPKNKFHGESKDCSDCCQKRLFIEIFESPKSINKLWKFKGWSTLVFDTKSALEENGEFLHIDVLKKDIAISIGIKKKDGSDDEFQVWVGDKQFVVKATKVTQEIDNECGKVISTHQSKEILE
jgi:hypothetical protein